MGCRFLQCMEVKSDSEAAQSCPTLGDPMGCSPPGSPVHGILQARVLEWVPVPSPPLSPSPLLSRDAYTVQSVLGPVGSLGLSLLSGCAPMGSWLSCCSPLITAFLQRLGEAECPGPWLQLGEMARASAVLAGRHSGHKCHHCF